MVRSVRREVAVMVAANVEEVAKASAVAGMAPAVVERGMEEAARGSEGVVMVSVEAVTAVEAEATEVEWPGVVVVEEAGKAAAGAAAEYAAAVAMAEGEVVKAEALKVVAWKAVEAKEMEAVGLEVSRVAGIPTRL